MKLPFTFIKVFLAAALLVSLLPGCSSSGQPADIHYPLESISDQGSAVSRIYRAANETVPQVANELADQNKPEEISKQDNDHMFLVYSDALYHIQKDSKKPADTLIEVSNKQFVEHNYSSSFLEGYLLSSFLHNWFGSYHYGGGNYRGYTVRDIYHPAGTYHIPTSQEKKIAPPLTKLGTGSIVKRGSNGKTITKSSSTGSSFTQSIGKIIRSAEKSFEQSNSSNRSIFSRPNSNSPPKLRVGGSGRLFRRR